MILNKTQLLDIIQSKVDEIYAAFSQYKTAEDVEKLTKEEIIALFYNILEARSTLSTIEQISPVWLGSVIDKIHKTQNAFIAYFDTCNHWTATNKWFCRLEKSSMVEVILKEVELLIKAKKMADKAIDDFSAMLFADPEVIYDFHLKADKTD